jgi:hypothetical protein
MRSTFPGLFTPLKSFDLVYNGEVPLTRVMQAGCGATDIDFEQAPDEGRAVVFGRISLDLAQPNYDFNTSVACFSNWATIWP